MSDLMKKTTLNIDYFKINEKHSNKIYYGCSQEWYRNYWQRRAGCGPTTAANLFIYLKNSSDEPVENDKYSCLLLMEEMWKYVTPTLRGVNTTKILYEGLYDYSVKNNLNVTYKYMDIAVEKKKRPSLDKALNFIYESLDKNAPLAFLNLSNGEEKRLDDWHWVTIVSFFLKNENEAIVEIIDEGKIKEIDFSLWYSTTLLGGGLVSFELEG